MQKRNQLLVVLALCCSAHPVPLRWRRRTAQLTPQPNTVWIGADGKFESEPDTALVQFNISAQEEKLQDANQRATQAAEQVRQLLRSNGIDPKDAQVGRFAVQPVYDYKNPKRKLVGYRVDTDISVKVKDFSKVGPIAEGLANMDVTSNQSISYQLDDIDAAKIKAVEDALRRAHDEANAVARSSGRSLGRALLRFGGHLRANSDTADDDGEAGRADGRRRRSCSSDGRVRSPEDNGDRACERAVCAEVVLARLSSRSRV